VRATRSLGVIASVGALVGLAGIAPVHADPVTLRDTVFATDVVMAGVGGMRAGDGTATINVAGVSGSVTQALLYWHGPTNSPAPAVNASVDFAGSTITGTNIGVSSDNCWGYDNSMAYRADVTSLVAGNGSYALSNFIKADADINGVSLVVFYDDGDPGNDRDVVLFEGNDSNVEFAGPPVDPEGWDVTLDGINYTSGSAAIDLIVADGQDFEDDDVVVNGTVVAAGPAVFQGDTVPDAGGPDQGGLLWDQVSLDVTSLLSPGPNTLNLTTGYVNDCLALIVAAVNLPAGAAPGQPTPTTPTTEEATTTTPATRPVAAVTPRFTG
jgi:hypothetical protein